MARPSRTRRSVLASTGIAAVAALAGCLNGDDDPPEDEGEAEAEPEPEPEDEGENGEEEYQLVADLLIYDEDDGSDEDVAEAFNGSWFGNLPTVLVGGSVTLRAEFIDSNGDILELGDDEEYTLRTVLADGAPDDVVSIDNNDDTVDLTGESAGEADIVFELYDGSAAEWESPPIPATVES